MDVYILDGDLNRFQSLTLVDMGNLDELAAVSKGVTPVAASWRPVEVEVLHEDETAEMKENGLGDFPGFGDPVFSARAVEVLDDLLVGRGELLPLTCSEGDFYLFNLTRIIDALDEERSELDRFDDGKVMMIDGYQFLPDRLAGETIFRLTQVPNMYEYVTDEVVRRIETAGLRGFRFHRRVWSES